MDSVKQLKIFERIEDGLDYMTYTDSTMEILFQKIENSLKSIVRKLFQ